MFYQTDTIFLLRLLKPNNSATKEKDETKQVWRLL